MAATAINLESNEHPLAAVAQLLYAVPPGRRPAVLTACLAFVPSASLEHSFQLGPIRAVIADAWELVNSQPVPIESLRQIFGGRVDASLWNALGALINARTADELEELLPELLTFLSTAVSTPRNS